MVDDELERIEQDLGLASPIIGGNNLPHNNGEDYQSPPVEPRGSNIEMPLASPTISPNVVGRVSPSGRHYPLLTEEPRRNGLQDWRDERPGTSQGVHTVPLPQKLTSPQRLTRSYTTQNQFDMYTEYGVFRDENERQRVLLDTQNEQLTRSADAQEKARQYIVALELDREQAIEERENAVRRLHEEARQREEGMEDYYRDLLADTIANVHAKNVAKYGPPDSALGYPEGSLPSGDGSNVPAGGTTSSVGTNVMAETLSRQDQRETSIIGQGPRNSTYPSTTVPSEIPPPSVQQGEHRLDNKRSVNFSQPLVTGQSSVPSVVSSVNLCARTVPSVVSQPATQMSGPIRLPSRSDTIRNGVGHEAVSIGRAPENRIDPGLTELDRLRLADTAAALFKADSDRQALATQYRTLNDQLLTERALRDNQITDLGPVLTGIPNMRSHVTSADAQERVVQTNKQADIVTDHLYDVNSQLRLARHYRNMDHGLNGVFRQPTPQKVPIRPVRADPPVPNLPPTQTLSRPKYPWDKGFNIIRGLRPTSSRETVTQEIIPNPYAETASVATASLPSVPPVTSGQRGHTDQIYSGVGPELLSQHTLGQPASGNGMSGTQPSMAGVVYPPYYTPVAEPGMSGIPPSMAGQSYPPYSAPIGPDLGHPYYDNPSTAHPSHIPRPDHYSYQSWYPNTGIPPSADPEYSSNVPGPNAGEGRGPSAPGSGSYGSGTNPTQPESTSRPSDGRPQMPNNHINNPWYYYGSQPIAELASATEELRKSAIALQRMPVVADLDKPPPGARNVTLKPYHSGKNIRHWFVEFEVYLCMIRCWSDEDKILQLHYLMSPHNFTFLETLSSHTKSNYETFKAALIERYKDKQLDNDKLRQCWLIHQEKDGHESVDTYYERLETSLVDALPDEHINTNKIYITLFESNLRPDIYCKYRDMTTGIAISTMEIARSYAINCEQLLKSTEYMEGVRMHQRSVNKGSTDHRAGAGQGSVPVTHARDRDEETGRYMRRESILPSSFKPRVRFRSRSPEPEPRRPRSPHIPVASATPNAPKPYSIHPRPSGGNDRPPAGPYNPEKINVPYRELKASSRTYTFGGVPKATHNGVTVGLGDALWNRWCKDHPPQEDRARAGRNFEQAMDKYNLLNGPKTAANANPTPVKVVDSRPGVHVIAPEYEDQEESSAWTEELVQEALAQYGIDNDYEYSDVEGADYVDVVPNPPGGDFPNRSNYWC